MFGRRIGAQIILDLGRTLQYIEEARYRLGVALATAAASNVGVVMPDLPFPLELPDTGFVISLKRADKMEVLSNLVVTVTNEDGALLLRAKNYLADIFGTGRSYKPVGQNGFQLSVPPARAAEMLRYTERHRGW
jgi:hypothetical protein